MGALLPLPSHFLSLCHGGVGGVRLLHTIAASYNFYYISANRVIALTPPSICLNPNSFTYKCLQLLLRSSLIIQSNDMNLTFIHSFKLYCIHSLSQNIPAESGTSNWI